MYQQSDMQLLRDLPSVIREGALHASQLDGDALLRWGDEKRGWMHLAVVLSITMAVFQIVERVK